jgi:LSD1 subclass zinc finger protein
MQNIPASETLPRCAHHVYWPAGDLAAYGCGTCRTRFPNSAAALGTFEMPKLSTHSADTLRANGHDPGACPNCESHFHYQVGANKARCADCGTEYRKKSRAENGMDIAA